MKNLLKMNVLLEMMSDCIIRRGVTIGDGAVVGANSVVTYDIPAFAVSVGSLARVIKFRFAQKQIGNY